LGPRSGAERISEGKEGKGIGRKTRGESTGLSENPSNDTKKGKKGEEEDGETKNTNREGKENSGETAGGTFTERRMGSSGGKDSKSIKNIKNIKESE
jgi:hypothetical protein